MRGLDSLAVEGDELHNLLKTLQADSIEKLPPGMVLPTNPRISANPEFIDAVALGSSLGRGIPRDGIRSALYARYTGDMDIEVEAAQSSRFVWLGGYNNRESQ